MTKKLIVLTVGVLALAVVGVLSLFQRQLFESYDAWTSGRVTFAQDFDGTVVDTEVWDTTHATQGLRYCARPRQWVDAARNGFRGKRDSVPYGTVSVANGEIRLKSGRSQTFPYIVAGLPTATSIFPESGDFVLELRMRFEIMGGFGCGFGAYSAKDEKPIGANPPEGEGLVFQVFGGRKSGLSVKLLDEDRQYSDDVTTYHTYRLEYVGGKYSVYVDGALKIGPLESSRRPNVVFLGNPGFAYNSFRDWSNFFVDFVRVRVPGS